MEASRESSASPLVYCLSCEAPVKVLCFRVGEMVCTLVVLDRLITSFFTPLNMKSGAGESAGGSAESALKQVLMALLNVSLSLRTRGGYTLATVAFDWLR